jgi:hypothetical protein
VGFELEEVPVSLRVLRPQRPPGPSEQPDLDSVPLSIKSSADSSLWAQGQCARRIGLTLNEAVTLLSFLDTIRRLIDENLDWNEEDRSKCSNELSRFRSHQNSLKTIKFTILDTLKEVRWWKLGLRG